MTYNIGSANDDAVVPREEGNFNTESHPTFGAKERNDKHSVWLCIAISVCNLFSESGHNASSQTVEPILVVYYNNRQYTLV